MRLIILFGSPFRAHIFVPNAAPQSTTLKGYVGPCSMVITSEKVEEAHTSGNNNSVRAVGAVKKK